MKLNQPQHFALKNRAKRDHFSSISSAVPHNKEPQVKGGSARASCAQAQQGQAPMSHMALLGVPRDQRAGNARSLPACLPVARSLLPLVNLLEQHREHILRQGGNADSVSIRRSSFLVA